jgi:hypothetical protein
MEKLIQQRCFDWVMRPDRLFCDLPADAMEAFDGIKLVTQYPPGAALFREGRRANHVFIPSEGRVKLSVCSESRKRLNPRIARTGGSSGVECFALQRTLRANRRNTGSRSGRGGEAGRPAPLSPGPSRSVPASGSFAEPGLTCRLRSCPIHWPVPPSSTANFAPQLKTPGLKAGRWFSTELLLTYADFLIAAGNSITLPRCS